MSDQQYRGSGRSGGGGQGQPRGGGGGGGGRGNFRGGDNSRRRDDGGGSDTRSQASGSGFNSSQGGGQSRGGQHWVGQSERSGGGGRGRGSGYDGGSRSQASGLGGDGGFRGRGGGGDGGFRGRGGRGDGGSRGRGGRGDRTVTPIRWTTEKLALDENPVNAPWRWLGPAILPQDQNEVKALMPKSKGSGTLGPKDKTIQAITNFFSTKIQPPEKLWRYEVNVTKNKKKRDDGAPKPGPSQGKDKKKGRQPPAGGDGGQGEAPLRINKDILKKLMQLIVSRLRTTWNEEREPDVIGIIHDFSRIIIATRQLEPTVGLAYTIQHRELNDEDSEDCSYNVTLAPADFTVDMVRARQLLQDYPDHPDLTEIKQVYNILLKNLGDGRYMALGRSSLLRISESNRGNSLGMGLMNWRGVAAVCTVGSTWKPFINIDIQNSAFFVGQNVMKAIQDIFQTIEGPRGRQTDPADFTAWDKKHINAVENMLKGCKVRRLVNNSPRDQKVTGLGPKCAAEATFDYEGRRITVADYFNNILRDRLQHPRGPILLLGGGRSQVPAEKCTIKDGQSLNRLLPPQTADNMLKKATEDPDVKHASIMKEVRELRLGSHELFQQFGVAVAGKMLELKDTRVLAAPELSYGKRVGGQNPFERGRLTPDAKALWDPWSEKVSFFQTATINAWAILEVALYQSPQQGDFASTLKREGNSKGLSFPNPICTERVNIHENGEHHSNVASIARKLEEIKMRFGHENKGCFVLCIMPSKRSVVYGQIKQASEREGNAAMLTQCIALPNYEKANHSVVKNLLLKINAKLGGVNHVPVFPPHLKNVNMLSVPALIIGIDVNHPSLPVRGRPTTSPSYAAVTGSLDRTGMPYMMHIHAQMRTAENRTIGSAEVVEGLEGIVRNMLHAFRNRTCGVQPRKIIVFRDGVGETQFPEVLQVEMQAIRRACTSLHADYKPCITFIAVQKRHKVRFFLKSGEDEISKANVPPGTVVDSEIVGRSTNDFYLASHYGALGTSRPTHYNVLWDDSDFTINEIQALSYYLCFMYSRCNRSVSYPAPTYYAHWAAARAKELGTGYTDWAGDQESLNRLNDQLRRGPIATDYPMHFI